jgi:hypothetical protein
MAGITEATARATRADAEKRLSTADGEFLNKLISFPCQTEKSMAVVDIVIHASNSPCAQAN